MGRWSAGVLGGVVAGRPVVTLLRYLYNGVRAMFTKLGEVTCYASGIITDIDRSFYLRLLMGVRDSLVIYYILGGNS